MLGAAYFGKPGHVATSFQLQRRARDPLSIRTLEQDMQQDAIDCATQALEKSPGKKTLTECDGLEDCSFVNLYRSQELLRKWDCKSPSLEAALQ